MERKRGKVIPVIDLRLKFPMPEEEHTKETCVIVVDISEQSNMPQQIGIIVDSVSEVLDINSGEIEDAPQFGQKIDRNLILSLDKTDERIVTLLDIEEVLSSEDLEVIEQIAKE